MIFIPEKYLKHTEVLVPLDGHGYGVFIEQKDLGKWIHNGRIASEVLFHNAFVVITED